MNTDKINGCLLGMFIGGVMGIFIHSSIISVKLDCPADYNGQIVVEAKGDGDYIISNGCEYSTVSFPAIYDFSLGDTIGKKTFKQKMDAQTKELQQNLKESIELQRYKNYTEKVLTDLEKELYDSK